MIVRLLALVVLGVLLGVVYRLTDAPASGVFVLGVIAAVLLLAFWPR